MEPLRSVPQLVRLASFAAALVCCTVPAAAQNAPRQAPPKLDALRIAGAVLPPGVKRSRPLDAMIADLRAGRVRQARASWQKMLEAGLVPGKDPADYDALIQWVLRESYMAANKELSRHADKVSSFNEAKKAIREEIEAARGELRTTRNWPIRRTALTLRKGRVPNAAPVERTARSFTRPEFDKYLSDLQAMLQTVGDDAQLANIDLQNVLQKQQQTLQMMSQVSKQLHDTAMAVIRKIG